jgi:hypothetical protein
MCGDEGVDHVVEVVGECTVPPLDVVGRSDPGIDHRLACRPGRGPHAASPGRQEVLSVAPHQLEAGSDECRAHRRPSRRVAANRAQIGDVAVGEVDEVSDGRVDTTSGQVALGDVAAAAGTEQDMHMFEDAAHFIGGVVRQHVAQTHDIEGSWFESGVPGLGSMYVYVWMAGFVEQCSCGVDCVGLAVDTDHASAGTDHLGHLESDKAGSASQVQHGRVFGDTGELPPVCFVLSSRLGHESVSLDFTIGQRQGVSAALAITHGGRFSHSSGAADSFGPRLAGQ